MVLDLSMVSEVGDFHCYNTSEEEPVHADIDKELQRLPIKTILTPETDINIENTN